MKCRVKDIDVYYEIYGEGRPIVMLHGFKPDHYLMTGCMEPIFQQRDGWKRIYPDLPGMGKTPGKEWLTHSDQMLDVVLEFIEQVTPNQHVVVAGESYGSYLARGIIYRKCALMDGLLLICPLINPDDTKRSVPLHVVLESDPKLLSHLESNAKEKFVSVAVVQNQKTWERTQKEVLVGLEVADEAFLTQLQTHGYAFSFDVDAVSMPFEKPTLILTGRQDSWVGYRDAWDILENYPRSTFAVLDRAGHNAQIEQEQLFNAFVNEWLDRVEENLCK
jgi:pimeloyl-ACP methyl ester carboxylesterase